MNVGNTHSLAALRLDLIDKTLLFFLAIDLPFCLCKSLAEQLSRAWMINQYWT